MRDNIKILQIRLGRLYQFAQFHQEADTGSKIEALEKQISGLTLMRAKNLLDDDEYSKEKATIKSEIDKLNKTPAKEKSNDEIIDLTKEKFVYSFHALKRFVEGNNNTKREVLADLGSNRQIMDKKPLITVNKWLLPILENAEMHNQELARFEPIIFGLDKRKDEALNMLRLSWLAYADGFRLLISLNTATIAKLP